MRALLVSKSCNTPRELFRCLHTGIVDNAWSQRCLSMVGGHDTGIPGTCGTAVAVGGKVVFVKVF